MLLIIAPNPDLAKLQSASTVTLQFSLKHCNAGEQFNYKWFLCMHYFNTTTNKFDSNSLSYFYSMLTGWLKEEDGWLTMSTPVTLPDMSGVIKTELKIEGPPTIDFLVDNVALII